MLFEVKINRETAEKNSDLHFDGMSYEVEFEKAKEIKENTEEQYRI